MVKSRSLPRLQVYNNSLCALIQLKARYNQGNLLASRRVFDVYNYTAVSHLPSPIVVHKFNKKKLISCLLHSLTFQPEQVQDPNFRSLGKGSLYWARPKSGLSPFLVFSGPFGGGTFAEPNIMSPSHSWSSKGNHVMSILQVLLNIPGGTYRQLPSCDTTTLVWKVPSNLSSALEL